MFSSSNIQVISNILLKASKVLRRDFGELEKLQNSRSSFNSFVENSYQNVQDLIAVELKNARPEWDLFFKKNEDDSFLTPKELGEKFCVIKPISGIYNFAKGISYFASSATYFYKSEPEASVIYEPIKDELFYSERGRGAFVNNSRIRFSTTKNLETSILVFNSKKTYLECIKESFSDEINKSDIRIFGCSCLDIANLAAGRIDCYVSDSVLHDRLEPALLFIKEAGGMTYQSKSINKINFYSNNLLTDKLKEVL